MARESRRKVKDLVEMLENPDDSGYVSCIRKAQCEAALKQDDGNTKRYHWEQLAFAK